MIDNSNIANNILELEKQVGLKEGFFENLLDEDDWSFVIKLHALFEATCTHLLLYHLKESKLRDIISRIELSGKTVGKTVMLDKLELLGKRGRRLISTLSEIRNSLVHDVRNSEFKLTDYISSLDNKSLEIFAVSFSPMETLVRETHYNPKINQKIDDKLLEQSKITNVVDRAKNDPKFHIWVGAYSTLISLLEMYDYSDYKNWGKSKSVLFDDDLWKDE